ncbi:PaaI family thioesterase [Bradyrhizobium sp.]|uniref:PaaI family thioesterase n=1 Tax=Bradyrhizobium sp. TaxID=376 RepID=UPI0039E478CB
MSTRSENAEHLPPIERLQFELAHPPYHAFLRPQAVSVDADNGVVEIRLPFRPEFQRVPDKPEYHGGVIAGLMDLTAHATVAVKIGKMAPNIDLRIDYLRGAAATDLHARGILRKRGRTLALVDVEVRDDQARLIAVARGTLSTSYGPP